MQLLLSLVGSSKVSSVSRIESISAGCLMWKLRETDMRTDVGDVLGVERDPFDEAFEIILVLSCSGVLGRASLEDLTGVLSDFFGLG